MDALFFGLAVVTLAIGPIFFVLYSMQTDADIEFIKTIWRKIIK